MPTHGEHTAPIPSARPRGNGLTLALGTVGIVLAFMPIFNWLSVRDLTPGSSPTS